MNFDLLNRIFGEHSLRIIGLLATVVLAELGCADPLGSPGTPVIRGRITFRGVPLRSGQVVFSHPDPESMDVWGMAQIGPDGSYLVDSDAGGHPLPAGWYRIAIWPKGYSDASGITLVGSSSSKQKSKEIDSDDLKTALEPEKKPKLQTEIPARYLSHETSDLKLWIRPQAMTIDIDLRD